MIVFKEEFIKRYLEKMHHKIEQELKEKLPDTAYFAEMVDQADDLVSKLFKIDRR